MPPCIRMKDPGDRIAIRLLRKKLQKRFSRHARETALESKVCESRLKAVKIFNGGFLVKNEKLLLPRG